jgi:hypothetical protein
MRYYLKCKLNPVEKERLARGIKCGSVASGKIFYEGMQSALRSATIDEDDVVHFIEICYCLEGGSYPMAIVQKVQSHSSNFVLIHLFAM